MDFVIEPGQTHDIDELEQLYNDLNDHLASHVNYPGWIKGVYPVRRNAVDGIEQGYLYVARRDGRIAGSIILSHMPEPAYDQAQWAFTSDYTDVIVIHTFAVHPDFLRCGAGRALMDFAMERAVQQKIKSIRLDVYEKNMPAIRLYEKYGFQYTGTVDLGYGKHGLDRFRLYEKLL